MVQPDSVFDASRAWLWGRDLFWRFSPPEVGVPLGSAGLSPDTVLLVFERGGQYRALLRSQMAYHHVAQGELAGEPYLVSF